MNLSDILGIAALIVSVLGIPITFVLARRARQRPDLRYAIDFNVILNPNDRLFDQGLYMTLGDNKIESISRTRVAIWNERGDTISGSDILETDPLRIQFNENSKPLQSRVVSMSREQIALSATDTEDCQEVLINFGFLDAKDGGVLEIIHQGTVKPTILGTLRGSTVRSSGSAFLNPDALARAERKSAVRRWWDNERADKITGALISGVGLAAIAFTIVLVKISFGGTSHLVNPDRYDLKTPKGQIAFSNAISSTGYYNHTQLWLLAVIVPLMAFFIVFAFQTQYGMIKRIIPREIAVYRPSGQRQNEMTTDVTDLNGSDANHDGRAMSVPGPVVNSGKEQSLTDLGNGL